MKDNRHWWETPGYSPGLTDALRRLHLGRRGQPADNDRPPVSVFPDTAAAREALRLDREGRKRR